MEDRENIGMTKMGMVIIVAALIIIASVGAAGWWFYLRPTEKKESTVDLGLFSQVASGGNQTISGSIEPAVADATVTLTFTRPDDSTFNVTVTSESDGSFTYTYTVDALGNWKVVASWPGNAEFKGATSVEKTFTVIFAGEPIKIGVIGPMEWIQGQGMKEASILAASEINVAGGVIGRELVIVTADEGFEPSVGVASMERLITVDNVDFVVGGFRTEIVFPMRDKAMDHKKIFIITGAATNELLDCTGSLTYPPPCGHCVKDDYNRYKYVFRTMPLNSTTLFANTLLPFLRYYMVNEVLGGGPDKKVKVGCLVENLAWNEVVWGYINTLPSYFTGPYGQIVYKARPSHTEDDFTTYLSEMRDAGVELIIHVFSGEAGLAFVKQWAEMQIPAIPVGINVLSQETAMWTDTDGKCEYETFLSSPPRANVSAKSLPFWDAYVDMWGHDPIYTSWGTYDAIYTIAEAVERAGTIDSDAVVAELEKTDRTSTIGRFKFTEYHDVYSPRLYEGVGEPPTGTFRWKTPEEVGFPNGWAAPMIVQWQNGKRVPVWPFGFPFTEELQLPPWM